MDTLQEFNGPLTNYKKTGFLKRHIAGTLDAIFVVVLVYIMIFLLAPAGYLGDYFSSINVGIVCFLIFILYRISTILFLSGTIGMLLLRCRYMTDSNIDLTTKEKILAALMVYINGVRTFNK